MTTALLLLMIWGGKAVVVNTSAFNPLETALEQFHFSDIYFHWHRGHNTEAESDMLLVDLQYLHDREEIATLLDSINAHHPRVVAVDVIFPQALALAPQADSHLVAALGGCPKLVLAENAVPMVDGGWRMERSFFADALTFYPPPHPRQSFPQEHSVAEGVVNQPSTVVRTVAARFDSLPTFAAEVACLARPGVVPSGDRTGLDLIDFGGVNLQRWTPGAEDYYLPALEDKLVFIGDMGDLRDWHNIPVSAGGQSRLPGLEVHALATAALLSPNPYRAMPCGLGLALQVLLLFGFCWLLYVLPQRLDNWVQGALQIVFMLLMLPVCYLLFVGLHLVCSPSLALVGFGLAGFAKNIIDAIIHQ